MGDILVADFQKNGRERVFTQLREWKGTKNVDVRIYVISKDSPDPIATPRASPSSPS
jgi:hypothetical protein